MVGLVEVVDALQRFLHGHALGVDLLAVADDARDGSEPTGDANRARVDIGRQPAVEHARVELVGFSIEVEIGAWEMRPKQRRPERHRRAEQVVHESVFGPSQARSIEPRALEESRRVDAAGMRRTHHDRGRQFGRLDERRKEGRNRGVRCRPSLRSASSTDLAIAALVTDGIVPPPTVCQAATALSIVMAACDSCRVDGADRPPCGRCLTVDVIHLYVEMAC